MKNANPFWGISLAVIGISTIILVGSDIIGIELADAFKRVLGVLELVCLPVLIYTTIRKK